MSLSQILVSSLRLSSIMNVMDLRMTDSNHYVTLVESKMPLTNMIRQL